MRIKTVGDFRKALRHGPYAWPGGYPVFFITNDGAALSYEAVKAERQQVVRAIGHRDSFSGWRVVAMDINWEDADLRCEHTGERIESAYGEMS